jgi:hypothetical protein
MPRYLMTKEGVLGIRLPPRRGFVETNDFKLIPPLVLRPLILREGPRGSRCRSLRDFPYSRKTPAVLLVAAHQQGYCGAH